MRIGRPKKRFVSLLYVVALCVVPVWSLAAPGALRAESWKAGVARVKITPQQFMWMSGYAHRSKPAEGTFCDLWARAMVLEDPDGKRGLLLSLDLIGIDRRLSQEICESLAHRYDLQRSQVAICCSHTHTGPVVGKCLEPLHYRQLAPKQQEFADQYERQLLTHVDTCVAAAIADLQPGHLAWGAGTATFAVNRRNNPEPKVPTLRAAGALKGPVDHDVPVLSVRDADGVLRAVVFGIAAHATRKGTREWSGDYPGFAAAELESRYEGCTALFWAGCGADQNPLPRRKLELAKDYGRQLADAVAHVLAGEMTAIAGSLKVAYQEVPLALDRLPSESDLKQVAASNDKYARARAEMLLQQLADNGRLDQTYPYPVGVWKLGDQVEFVFLGGEVVVDFAIRLKLERRGCRTWVAGYTNDVMAYIPSDRVLREGGYEGIGAMVYYGLPAAWARGAEQTIIDAAGHHPK